MNSSRRIFLRGAGASLALPILPSLLSAREAKAQLAENRRCFVMYSTGHGGVWAENMFPLLPSQGVELREYAGRTIRRFPLQASRSNGLASISPVLTARDTELTDRLVSKMFSVQGLDVPFYLAHHTGGYLGNFARNDRNGDDGLRAHEEATRRTIDQIMAWSTSFYPDLSGVRERAIVLSRRISYNYSNPSSLTGAIEEVGALPSRPQQLFDQLFPQTGDAPTRPPIIDRVLESYQRLRQSSRISTVDRRRLEEHVQRVHELDRRLGTQSDCSAAAPPQGIYANLAMSDMVFTAPYANDPVSHGEYSSVLNDVIVTALSCGVSRVAVAHFTPRFSSFAGDWHQDVAHQASLEDGVSQRVLYESFQRIFSDVIVDLAQKMDAIDNGDGSTLLDNSLVTWTHESGNTTHNSQSVPVIGFGSAGGRIQTGSHVDYRNLNAFLGRPQLPRYVGILWHQWLGQVLTAMGIPKLEYERPEVNGGYPDYNHASIPSWERLSLDEAYPASVWTASGEPLPWLG